MSRRERGGAPFTGAKIALICHDGSQAPAIPAYRRDDFAHLPFPGHWDLPGGGREGRETPQACVLRELEEEFGLRLPRDRLSWHLACAPAAPGALPAHFFGGRLAPAEVAAIRFGSEGQAWRMMPLAECVAHSAAVPHLRLRAAAFWTATQAAGLDAAGAS